jgi:CelD/BcsL family acetyltransferase involved in cellulose biosynthesis
MRADAFIFQNLRHPTALGQELAHVASARPIGGGWCPVIRLDRFANWDAYAATLPKSLVSDQRRQWKRVQRALPGLSFRLVDRGEMIQPVLDWVSRHKVSWAGARGNRVVWFHAQDKRCLLQAVAESALNDGNLVLATLSDGDTIISAGWGYLCGSEFLFHAFAYDATYATYSPSRLFLERLVQLCFDIGIRTLDFMPGEEPYKRTWATDYVQTESYIGPLSWRGACVLRLASLKPGSSESAVAIKRLYRMLPSRIREVVQRRSRAYRLVDDALSLKLIREPPQDSAGSDTFR